MDLTRRSLMAGTAAWLALPSLSRGGTIERQLLVLVARGGWDATCALDPKPNVSSVQGPEHDVGGRLERVERLGGIPVAVHPQKRPSVRRFFAAHGHRSVVINGIGTGTADHGEARRRWRVEELLPRSTRPSMPLSVEPAGPRLAPVERIAEGDRRGAPVDLGSALPEALARLERGDRAVAVDSGLDWDTHADPERQHHNHERLFRDLHALVDGLAARGRLETTLVAVVSELGRAPVRNVHGGKDHWPVTSALLVGGGIAGGRVLGGTDDRLRPVSVDPWTGGARPGGVALDVGRVLAAIDAHLRPRVGATALRLA